MLRLYTCLKMPVPAQMLGKKRFRLLSFKMCDLNPEFLGCLECGYRFRYHRCCSARIVECLCSARGGQVLKSLKEIIALVDFVKRGISCETDRSLGFASSRETFLGICHDGITDEA